jgi:hypothetical protein
MDKRMAELKKFSQSFKVGGSPKINLSAFTYIKKYSSINQFLTIWFPFWRRMKRNRSRSARSPTRTLHQRRHVPLAFPLSLRLLPPHVLLRLSNKVHRNLAKIQVASMSLVLQALPNPQARLQHLLKRRLPSRPRM